MAPRVRTPLLACFAAALLAGPGCIAPPSSSADSDHFPDAGALSGPAEIADDRRADESACAGALAANPSSTRSGRPDQHSPSDGAICQILGGSVSGLRGSGLVLANGSQEITIDGDGSFTFPTPLMSGSGYAVTVARQPSDPAQQCAVFNHAGAITDSAIGDVRVVCSPCGDGRLDVIPAGSVVFEWRVTAAKDSAAEISFAIDGVLVARDSVTATGDRCSEPIVITTVTDAPSLSLLDSGDDHQFAVTISEGADLAWAVATAYRPSGQSEIAIFDPHGDGAQRRAGCRAFHRLEAAGVAVTTSMPMTESCDDGNLVSGDGCSAVCQSESCTPGSDRDNDGLDDCAETNTGRYVSAADTGTDPRSWDTDRDGISDGDEVFGTEAGLDLPAMGVSPVHRDLLVETDWLADDEGCGAHNHRPADNVVDLASAMYASAPLVNPDGTTGIRLHIDRGQGGPFTGGNQLGDGTYLYPSTEAGPFPQYKSEHFAADRVGYFHYAVLAHDMGPVGGIGELGGDDLAVATGGCDVCFQCGGAPLPGYIVAVTIAHELGHNLGLHHGGDSACNYKPNYPSIMNYRDAYAGIDIDCDGISDRVMDFSRGARLPLDERALSEADGVCGTRAIDWDGSRSIDGAPVASNINAYANEAADCGDSHTFLRDHDDWSRVRLNGITADGGGLFAPPLPCFAGADLQELRRPAAPDWKTVAGPEQAP